jgi:hypothetical protein
VALSKRRRADLQLPGRFTRAEVRIHAAKRAEKTHDKQEQLCTLNRRLSEDLLDLVISGYMGPYRTMCDVIDAAHVFNCSDANALDPQ